MFKYAHRHLEANGWFLNIDVSLAPAEGLENWYLDHWAEQIVALEKQLGKTESVVGVIQRYKQNPADKPDSITDQLAAMREAGFTAVDCIFKDGVFVVYCGQKR